MMKWFQQRRLERQVQALITSGKQADALKLLDQACQDRPKHIGMIIQRLWVKQDLGRHEEVLQEVDALLKSHEKHPVLLMVRGESLYRLERLSDARSCLEESLKFGGDNLRIDYLLGLVALAASNFDAATSHFEKLVRYDRILVHARLLTYVEHAISKLPSSTPDR